MILPYLFFAGGLVCAAATLLVVGDLTAVLELGGTAMILIVAGWLIMFGQFVSGLAARGQSRGAHLPRLPTSTSVRSVDVHPGGGPGSIYPDGVPMPRRQRGGAAGPTFERWPYRVEDLAADPWTEEDASHPQTCNGQGRTEPGRVRGKASVERWPYRIGGDE